MAHQHTFEYFWWKSHQPCWFCISCKIVASYIFLCITDKMLAKTVNCMSFNISYLPHSQFITSTICIQPSIHQSNFTRVNSSLLCFSHRDIPMNLNFIEFPKWYFIFPRKLKSRHFFVQFKKARRLSLHKEELIHLHRRRH